MARPHPGRKPALAVTASWVPTPLQAAHLSSCWAWTGGTWSGQLRGTQDILQTEFGPAEAMGNHPYPSEGHRLVCCTEMSAWASPWKPGGSQTWCGAAVAPSDINAITYEIKPGLQAAVSNAR